MNSDHTPPSSATPPAARAASARRQGGLNLTRAGLTLQHRWRRAGEEVPPVLRGHRQQHLGQGRLGVDSWWQSLTLCKKITVPEQYY